LEFTAALFVVATALLYVFLRFHFRDSLFEKRGVGAAKFDALDSDEIATLLSGR
jgi:hypothetical protein